MQSKNVIILTLLSTVGSLPAVYAASPQNSPEILQQHLNIVWVCTAAILVFFMQAGFALLESGMTRTKNAVNVLMKNFTDVCVGSLVYFVLGFGLMFGANATGFFGENYFLPQQLDAWGWTFFFFQLMFAATATTIASGAMAERTHFKGYLVGVVMITAIIYPIYGSWAWGGFFGGTGWLKELGFIDFAGSSVVHAIGGWCALAGILVIGPRIGRFGKRGEIRHIPGHNLGFVALGGFILWLAWFGFNAGSTLEANMHIGKIAVNTHLSAVASAVSTLLLSHMLGQPALLTRIVNATIGGLVAVTAGCATMDPVFAIVTGAIAGPITVFGAALIAKLKLDDVVDAVAVHAFCGSWGTLAAGLFYADDLFNSTRVATQLIGIGAAFAWGFGASLLMYIMIHKTVGLRATALEEQRGLDVSEHAEIGYPEFQTSSLFDVKKHQSERNHM